MYLTLATIDVWTLQGDFAPAAFFRALPILLQPGDVIAFGAYSPSTGLRDRMIAFGAGEEDHKTVYDSSFEFNREEHPEGRPFELAMSQEVVEALVSEAKRTDGQDDKALFFDHVIAYRRGTPVIPLFCFHNAFSGGELRISGLYPEVIVERFASGLPSIYRRERNPENYH